MSSDLSIIGARRTRQLSIRSWLGSLPSIQSRTVITTSWLILLTLPNTWLKTETCLIAYLQSTTRNRSTSIGRCHRIAIVCSTWTTITVDFSPSFESTDSNQISFITEMSSILFNNSTWEQHIGSTRTTITRNRTPLTIGLTHSSHRSLFTVHMTHLSRESVCPTLSDTLTIVIIDSFPCSIITTTTLHGSWWTRD